MRSEGGSRMGEEETTVVANERRIMLSGRTESGARFASMFWGGRGGMDPGRSATVEVRRSDECMLRRCCCCSLENWLDVARRHEDDEDLREEGEERQVRRTGRRIARRPGTESMIGWSSRKYKEKHRGDDVTMWCFLCYIAQIRSGEI